MISPLYFKPRKRSAGGDIMISFVMEKCLILPMCACVQNIKKEKKGGNGSLFYELSLESFKQHMYRGAYKNVHMQPYFPC